MRGPRKAAGLLKLLMRSPPSPAASHRLGGRKSQNLRTSESSMTDPLTGSAAHGLAMQPPSVVLESITVAIQQPPRLDFEGRTGTFKIRVARGQNRDLGQPKGSERDGDAVPARFY